MKKSDRHSTRLRVGRGSPTPKIRTIGAALDTRTAILHAGRSGDFPANVVLELLNAFDQGEPLNDASQQAAQWALSLSVNHGQLRPLAAHRAARCLEGWR